eukprot:GHVU01069537.1.p2 GENE.GHVU01069537.1~~GHVU01069537.1.p2  ORF type:complete len:113 (-),score=2.90 GHVU01069537.1:199-537(-)
MLTLQVMSQSETNIRKVGSTDVRTYVDRCIRGWVVGWAPMDAYQHIYIYAYMWLRVCVRTWTRGHTGGGMVGGRGSCCNAYTNLRHTGICVHIPRVEALSQPAGFTTARRLD